MRTAHFAADEVGARDLRPTRDPQAGPATRFFYLVTFVIVVFGGVMVVTHLINGQKF